MKRRDPNTDSLVYAYGCAAPVSGLCEADAEVLLQRRLWDRLVAIDAAAYEHTWEQSSADDPAIAETRAEIERIGREIDTTIAERRGLRAKARAKVATPLHDKRIDELFAARRAQRAGLWAGLRQWRKEHPAKAKAIEDERRAAVTQARRQSGLYWGNYNRVIQSYDTARLAVRRKGRRLRRSDEERRDGCLTVQIQRTKTGLGASMDEILAGKVSACRILQQPWTVGSRTYPARLEIRCDAANHHLAIPLFLHRLPPAGMRIKQAQLTWRPEGMQTRYQLALSLSGPHREVRHRATTAVGIDVGWRLEPDRALLVATTRDSGGATQRYRLPARWMSAMDQVERLCQHLADHATAMAAAMQPLLESLPSDLSEPLSRWTPDTSASRIDQQRLHDSLRRRIRQAQATGGPVDAPAPILEWYRRYRHLAIWRDRLRGKLLRRRRHLYRNWAGEIAQRHAVISIEEIDLSQLARTRKRQDASDPELHAAARAQRQRAAVHELLQWIEHQARKHGAEIVRVDGPTTQVCKQCGQHSQWAPRSDRHWICAHCAAEYDQDINAADNLLAVAEGNASSPELRRVEA